jgi:hypothetical protein
VDKVIFLLKEVDDDIEESMKIGTSCNEKKKEIK